MDISVFSKIIAKIRRHLSEVLENDFSVNAYLIYLAKHLHLMFLEVREALTDIAVEVDGMLDIIKLFVKNIGWIAKVICCRLLESNV